MEFDDEQAVSPMSDEVQDYCWSHGIDPRIVLERITSKMRDKLPEIAGDVARQRVLKFLVENEYRFCLLDHISDITKTWSSEDEIPAGETTYEDRIEALQRKYNGRWGKGTIENAEDPQIPEIDKSVAVGGRTLLHQAVMDNDLDEVKRLIEEEGAKTNVKDNFKQTPYRRALDFGYTDIAEYLAQY